MNELGLDAATSASAALEQLHARRDPGALT